MVTSSRPPVRDPVIMLRLRPVRCAERQSDRSPGPRRIPYGGFMKILTPGLRVSGAVVVLLGLALTSAPQAAEPTGFHRAGGQASNVRGQHQHHPEADDQRPGRSCPRASRSRTYPRTVRSTTFPAFLRRRRNRRIRLPITRIGFIISSDATSFPTTMWSRMPTR